MTIRQFYLKQEKLCTSLNKESYPVFLYLLHVLKYNQTELYMHFDDVMKKEDIDLFNEGFEKYLYHNEPIQYLIGYHEFYGYQFQVDNRVLIPRFETEELVSNILNLYDDYFDGQEVSACDIGTGSGAIAITLEKEEKNFKVIGTDISEDALEVARINNQKLGTNVRFVQGDMLEPLKGNRFDFIISNPPYIPETEEVNPLVKDNEPNVALFGGEDGLRFYRIILEGAKDVMKEKAIIAFEHGYNKAFEIEQLAKKHFPDCKVIHQNDLQGKQRMTFVLVGDFKC